MTSTIKVDTIQLSDGSAPTAADLGFAAGSVLQYQYFKNSTKVASSGTSYDVITANFTPKSSTSTLLLNANIYISETAADNLDGGVKILRDGTAVETDADSDASRGGSDVLDSMDDLWSGDTRSQWFRMRLGGQITTPSNSTDQSTFILRVQSDSTRNWYINRFAGGTSGAGVSYLTITEIAG